MVSEMTRNKALAVQSPDRLTIPNDQFPTPTTPPGPATETPAIDMSAIAKMGEEGEPGNDFITQITTIFLKDMDERVATIGSQLEAKDLDGIMATAHALRGSCSHFGAIRLMGLCGQIESRARRSPVEEIEPLIRSMLVETERVRFAIEVYRNALSD
jgi:HPt (histidine-containing phosphotransfer) domain-containing protein